MFDQEKMKKILNGLECRAENRPPHCDKCQYKTKFAGHNICDFAQICKDVFALLKAQEPVEVKIEQDTYPDETPKGLALYYCGNCGDDIADGQKFCANCGKPVKWDA